ncbi:MAG: divalent-cation tolerance protein CutA [Thermosynechococcaceae cyanobacterium]
MPHSPSPNEYCVVWVTASSQSEAQAIAHALVQEQLAACVSLMPITSIYTWQGQVQEEAEWQLVIKTQRTCFDPLQARIQSLHSYEVPEIIALPIQAGSSAYLDWIAANVKP